MVKKADFNAKVTEIEGKIPSISGLATNSALTSVENKIPDASSLVKMTDYSTKISDFEKKIIDHNHDKYITTLKFNTMTADVFNTRLAAKTVFIRKPEFNFELKGISDRATKNKTKHLLNENELKKNYINLIMLILQVKVFRRRWYTKLFSFSANIQIF